VIIKSAAYSNRKKALTVTAKSTAQPGTVTLTAQGYGPMAYAARKKVYKGAFKTTPKPTAVTVISSGGGTQTRNIP
jgi:hypothetical protein